MRRRVKRRQLFLKPFLLILLLIIITGVSYAYLSASLNITGKVIGINTNKDYIIDPNSNPNLDISNFSLNRWQESGLQNTQYNFDVVNTGNEKYDNFKLTITFDQNLENVQVWDYEYSFSGRTLTIINNKYMLNKNRKLQVGFIATTNDIVPIINIKLEIKSDSNPVDLNSFPVDFIITNGWGNYTYQYNVTVTNQTGQSISAWQLEVALPNGTTYQNGWNAIFNNQGNTLMINNANYNGRLKNGESTSFGLQLDTDIINFIPSDIVVTVR